MGSGVARLLKAPEERREIPFSSRSLTPHLVDEVRGDDEDQSHEQGENPGQDDPCKGC